jgi:8-oxo-dGTP diphosphatase
MRHDVSATPYVAAFALFRREGKVAFLLRENTGWRDGYYSLPSGRVDKGENFKMAAVREIKEEVDVETTISDLQHLLTANRQSDDGSYWVDVIFEVTKWQGELRNAEPHKHGELVWLSLTELPENIVPAMRHYLQEIAAGKSYTEYGW